MAIGEDRFPASFRGISFLVPSESERGGIKSAIHEYPGADFRFVEDLGTNPSVFSITAIIHGVGATARRAALVRALQQEGTGVLVHPAYGSIQVKATDYTASSSDASLGEYRFNITFYESRQAASLSATATTATGISSLVATFRENLTGTFGSLLTTPLGAVNLASAIDVAVSISETVRAALTLPSILEAQAAIFTGALDFIDDTPGAAVATARSTAESIGAVMTSTTTLYADISDPLEGWLTLSAFESGEPQVARTTASRIQRENSRTVMEDYIRLFSLASAMEASTYNDYMTSDEVVSVIQRIDALFSDVVKSPSSDLSSDFDLSESMAEIYAGTIRLLRELNVTTPMVSSIETDASSAALTAYQFYGTIEREEAIAGLNSGQNRAVLTGNIDVLVA